MTNEFDKAMAADEKMRAADEKLFKELSAEFEKFESEFGMPQGDVPLPDNLSGTMFAKAAEGESVQMPQTQPTVQTNDFSDVNDSETLKLILNELQMLNESVRQMLEG